MNELIKITQEQIGESHTETVDARELHKFLGSKRDFSSWIKKQIEDFGYRENTDFIKLPIKGEPMNKRLTAIEYHLSLEMGKHIGMLERNEKGRAIRDYFIECEKRAHQQPALNLPENFQEALLALAAKVGESETYRKRIEADKPKVEFAMDFKATENSVDVAEYAKRLGIGSKTLFKWFRHNGYLTKDNKPMQSFVKTKVLEYETRTYEDKKTGVKRSYGVVMVTAKGQTYFWAKKLPEQEFTV